MAGWRIFDEVGWQNSDASMVVDLIAAIVARGIDETKWCFSRTAFAFLEARRRNFL
jgi:hypothetical protein